MTPSLRTLVAIALLTSGAVQVAAASGEDACCAEEAEEKGASCPECPPGIACACYPTGGAVQAVAPKIAAATSPGIALAVAAAEPSAVAAATDIFHPPRA
jgi:hypothetical protein